VVVARDRSALSLMLGEHVVPKRADDGPDPNTAAGFACQPDVDIPRRWAERS